MDAVLHRSRTRGVTLYLFGSARAPNHGLSPPPPPPQYWSELPMMVVKGAKSEEKSDFIRILMAPCTIFTLLAPNRIGKVTSMR